MKYLAISLFATTLLGGCASTGGESNYSADLRTLEQTCRERGGILATTGRQTGRPETDNVCKITGQPSPLTRSN